MNTPTRSASVHRSLLVVVAVALAAAACAGDDAADTVDIVDIVDNTYQPADLEVASGASVTWTNQDDVPHTVTFSDGPVSSSDQLEQGDTFTATFDEPGAYAYVCAVHPEMEATVTVTG